MGRLGFALVLLTLLSGCASKPPAGRIFPTTGELTELNVLTAPVGLDFNGRPGLDGFSMKVYGNIANSPKPVPIRSGQIDILMFDGTLYGRTNLPAALRRWTFTAEQLRDHEFTARIGTGYEFNLEWETNKPTRQIISVGARYTSPTGAILTSSLSSVTVIDH